MLILDTNVLRQSTTVAAIRTRHPGSKFAAPAVVVMELLHQRIRGEIGPCAALELIGTGHVEVLPEWEEGLRACFKRPMQLSSSHPKEWRRLAKLASKRDLPHEQLVASWNELADSGRVGWSAEKFQREKADKRFQDEMRALFTGLRDKARRVADQRPVVLKPANSQWVLSLVGHHLMCSQGLVRYWLLEQLAAICGVDVAIRRLASPSGQKNPFADSNDWVTECYRGGLETLVALFEARSLPWFQKFDHEPEPEVNDLFDMMVLASVGDSPDQVFVTKEKAWLQAAARAGLESRVVTPELLLDPPVFPICAQKGHDSARTPDVVDWLAAERDSRVARFRPKGLTATVLERALRDGHRDAASACQVDVHSWWPQEGPRGGWEATAWFWAVLRLVFEELPVLAVGKTTLTARFEYESEIPARKRLLERLWSSSACLHLEREVVVDFCVQTYERPGNPVLLTAMCELSNRQLVVPSMGEPCEAQDHGPDDNALALCRLLLVQSPYRLFVARVGGADGDSEAHRMGRLCDSLGEAMQRFGRDLVSGAELGAVLVPESACPDLTDVRLGVWGAQGWTWTRPRPRPPAASHGPRPGGTA